MGFQIGTHFLLWMLNKTLNCLEVVNARDGQLLSLEGNWLRAKQLTTKR